VFEKWNKDYGSIVENTEVKALFIEVNRYYQVRFIGKDGIILNEQIVEYGTSAIDPIKTLEIEYLENGTEVRAVTGWSKDLSNILENLDVYAIYEIRERHFIVKFYNDDRITLLGEFGVEYGKTSDAPNNPIKESTEDIRYDFAGWSLEFDYVTGDMNIYAVYNETATKFAVKFIDGDGNIFEEMLVLYGETATKPNGIPTKKTEDGIRYIFIEWDQDFSSVKEDLTIYALFKEETVKLIVRFVDDEGSLIKEEYVLYGKSASLPTGIIPPDATVEFEYLIKWIGSYENVTEDTEVVLTFEQVIREYTYTFYGAKGEINKQVRAAYGTLINIPNSPIKAMSDKYTYTFVSWSPEVSEYLIEDVNYYPEYLETLRVFIITYLDGDQKVYSEVEVVYGHDAMIPDGFPTKKATKQYFYTFKNWETRVTSVFQDQTIRAIFNQHLQKYKVTFVDEFDNILKVQEVEYGSGATEPTEIPVKSDTSQYSYVFSGWSRPFANVTEDIVVKTLYIGVLRKYAYTFYDDDQVTILKQVSVVYGSQIIPPQNPTKVGTVSEQYIFDGWDKVVADTISEDINYYATYKIIPKTFMVIFFDGDGRPIDVQEINYGKSANSTKIPTKLANQLYQYEFDSWIGDYSFITADLNVHPSFIQTLKKFKVQFVYHDNSYTEVFIEYGKSAVGKVPTPLRSGYRFINWNKDISVITQDTIVKAIYVANEYQINFYSDQADSGYMDSMIISYDSIFELPENVFERLGYYFVGWKKEGEERVSYLDNDNVSLNSEGLDLYADWLPIIYSIEYHLDGGVAINPDRYTVEDNIVLQSAFKENYKFTGWYIKHQEESMFRMMNFTAASTSEPTYEQVTAIEEGTVGNIELYANYAYNGFVKLKDNSELQMVTAVGLATSVLTERTFYNEEVPIYLMGIFLGQTVGNLRENFVNEGIVYLDKDGNQLSDDSRITTGSQIIVYDDGGLVKDKIIAIIKGDIDGDGYITFVDFNLVSTAISNTLVFNDFQLLAADVYEDGYITYVDFNFVSSQINGQDSLHDPDKKSTLV
jgi:hypothetical protein